MEYLTTTELSAKWKVSARRIALYCAKGRIPGVIKKEKHGKFRVILKS